MDQREYGGFRDLTVYKKAYTLSIEITRITIPFPKEEKYALTDQIRRSSRSVPANITEAWAKRIYQKSFVTKIIDAYGEELETEMWLDMALDFGYIQREKHEELLARYEEVRKMLIYMSKHPEVFCK